MKNAIRSLVTLVALGAIAALLFLRPQPAEAEMKTITGTVAYRERIALPPDAKVEVKLVDVSLQDAPSITIAEHTIEPKGQVPVAFTLSYDPTQIQPSHSYALQARVTVNGELMFINDERYAVLTSESDTTDMMLKRVGGVAATQQPAAGLHGAWLAEDINGGGVIDNLQTTLTIAPDGSVSGLGGCNNFSGKATIAGDAMTFGPLAATRKACIPAVGDQEAKFFDALSKARAWRIDAFGKLELLDDAGQRVVLMARQ